MHTKLNLRLETRDEWKFPIAQKFFTLAKVGKKIENIPWINLFVVIEGSKISFFLDMHPLSKSKLYYGVRTPRFDETNVHSSLNAIIFPEKILENENVSKSELVLLPNGFPWSYADRKNQFKDLSYDTPCVIFWCGPYELRINKACPFFDDMIEMLKRE